MKKDSKIKETPQVREHSVMRGYFGLPFDFKITTENGDVMFINDEKSSLLLLTKLDLAKFKMQQFTGILDRNKAKIYFGDKMIFADKVEWYRGEYWSKVMFGHMTKKQALEEIKSRPHEERIVENNEDFEWLLSSDIRLYWEVVL